MSAALAALTGPDANARTGIAAAAVVLLEGLLLVVVAGLVPRAVGAHGEIPSAPAVLIVLSLGALFSFRLGEAELPNTRRWLLGVGVTIVVLQVVGRVDLSESARIWSVGWAAEISDPDSGAWRGAERLDHALAMAVLAFAWFRGVALGNTDLSERPLSHLLPVAVIVFGLGFLVGDAADVVDRVRITALLFLAAALLAVAFRNAQRLTTSEGGFSALGVTFVSTFGAMAVVAIIFMLIVTLLVAAIAGTGLAEPVTDALGVVLRAVATATAWVVWILLWPIRELVSGAADPFPPQPQCFINELGELECLSEGQSAAGELDSDEDSGAGTVAFRVFAGIGLVLGVTILAALLFRQVWRRRRPADEERESLWSEADPFGDLWSGLRNLGRRLRPHRGPAQEPGIGGLYLEMLADAQRRGTERPIARTPLQFSPSLQRLYRSPLPLEISERFMEQRYAGREPAGAEVARLRLAWESLRAAEPG